MKEEETVLTSYIPISVEYIPTSVEVDMIGLGIQPALQAAGIGEDEALEFAVAIQALLAQKITSVVFESRNAAIEAAKAAVQDAPEGDVGNQAAKDVVKTYLDSKK